MNITRATPSDLDRIRRLMQRGRHIFQNLGREDWQSLLNDGVVLLGSTGGLFGGTPAALLGVRREARPTTLPADAPSRAYITCAAVARGRSAITDVPALVSAASQILRDEERAAASGDVREGPGWQMIYYDADNWLVRPLLAAGFEQIDRVQFLALTRLSRRVDEINERLAQSAAQAGGGAAMVELRPARVDEVEQLARLDGEAFDSIWHMDERHLLELLMSCHVCVAVADDGQGSSDARLLGYAALCGPAGIDPFEHGSHLQADASSEAMLARLAVHPSAQGRGIGRRLLVDSLSAAHERGAETVVLNTQTSNARSQALYRSLGFRRTGEIYPVLTRTV